MDDYCYPYVITSRLGKEFQLQPDGKLVSDPARMDNFSIQPMRLDLGNPASIRCFCENTKLLAVPTFTLPVGQWTQVVAQKALQYNPGAVARTKTNFAWPAGPAMLLLDFDLKFPSQRLLMPAELGLPADTGFLTYASSSSFIADQNGQLLRGHTGQHVVLFVEDGRDIPAMGRMLYLRAWLAGTGCVVGNGVGSLLQYAAFDSSVWRPERLVFGLPILPAGLQRVAPPPYYQPGTCINLARCQLTPEWTEHALQLIAAAIAAQRTSPATVAAKRTYAAANALPGETVEIASERIEQLTAKRTLPSTHKLILGSGEVVTVAQVVANWPRYRGTRLHDPLEPGYGNNDPRIALFSSESWPAGIFSHAHGRQRWRFELPGVGVPVQEIVNPLGEVMPACFSQLPAWQKIELWSGWRGRRVEVSYDAADE